ncbi:MAG: hypothetical protein JWQ90_4410 [Hydrocarboniphaga sp.]|uniref:HvfC/BufC N-terminal domain-containing protein n=1 Tax=Hydrocarboniphaga sp. TaxID=2033016 RepID=UPI00260214F1|nr:DNA-binding domain-containing protein [Hydrocarboniphaga sp.]MDB5971960.1 hypothetical protein [Hydrocarboniphaga sp.]
MSELALLQRNFSSYVLQGDDAIHAAVVEDQAASAERRLGVYYQAYRLRLVEVLRNDFPGLRHLCGADAFEEMACAYVEVSPSPHFNLRWYGARLAGFLGDTAPWSRTPALAEMAALEWEMTLAFDAIDEPAAVIEDVAALAPEHWPLMQLAFSGSLRRVDQHWNVAAIRLALDLERDIPEAAQLDALHRHAVWRIQLGVRHRALQADESAALDAALQGARFGEICERLCEWHDETAVAMRAAELLKRWIQDQWISALIVLGAAAT